MGTHLLRQMRTHNMILYRKSENIAQASFMQSSAELSVNPLHAIFC